MDRRAGARGGRTAAFFAASMIILALAMAGSGRHPRCLRLPAHGAPPCTVSRTPRTRRGDQFADMGSRTARTLSGASERRASALRGVTVTDRQPLLVRLSAVRLGAGVQ